MRKNADTHRTALPVTAIIFPLRFRFKSIAIARQVAVEDGQGRPLWYAKAATFALKEAVTVFADRNHQRAVFAITSNSLIDVGARYSIKELSTGAEIGAVQHVGAKSLWHAHYEILRAGSVLFVVREENPFANFLDKVVGGIPILGQLIGYAVNVRYTIKGVNGATMAQLARVPALFQEQYEIRRENALRSEDLLLLAQGLLMVSILEKERV